ncbi:hypothetical protein FSP39_019332 [Pinctada imbricata]|uniref:PHD-type domain-containing protein n=1 Tax=Pinctada imbricata TaxID=66713 RepID=A0AA88Y8K0_PINIB|nr:hypothetical protein FSP39_019332 [Pinctada imbricata]
MSDLCIQCGRPVTNLQHAVTCDRCDQWQHRTCDTGISLNLYRQAVSQNIQISFLCKPCQPLAHSAPSANDSLPILEPVLPREVHTPEMVQRHDDDPSILDTSFDVSRSTVYPFSPPSQSPYQSMCEPSLPRDVTTPVLPPKPSTTIDDPIEPLPSRSDDLEANVLDTARIES